MFGLGGQEILLLLVLLGGPAVLALILVLTVGRRSRRERELEAENRELRRQLGDRDR